MELLSDIDLAIDHSNASSLTVLSMLESSQSQSPSPASKTSRSAKLQDDSCAESRLNPISGKWTIFAPLRNNRPDEFVASGETINHQLECPFCCGNEEASSPAVWVGRIDDGEPRTNADGGTDEDWSVRVVPNLYPAVNAIQSSDETRSSAEQTKAESLFTSAPVFGGHDVIIESRQHILSLSQLDLDEVRLTFLAYRDRIRFWRSTPGISYISLFKNVGERAGASLRHSHSQLIATDRIPIAVESSIHRMHRHRAETGCCLHCDLIREEQEANSRIVWQDASLIAFCPFASRLPMLLRITTQQHQARFEELADLTIESVSRLVHRAVSWLESIRPATAYNIALSTLPPGTDPSSDSFHWSIDLFPRMNQMAGFEWTSGCHINPVLPEAAAAAYRKVAQAEDPRAIL